MINRYWIDKMIIHNCMQIYLTNWRKWENSWKTEFIKTEANRKSSIIVWSAEKIELITLKPSHRESFRVSAFTSELFPVLTEENDANVTHIFQILEERNSLQPIWAGIVLILEPDTALQERKLSLSRDGTTIKVNTSKSNPVIQRKNCAAWSAGLFRELKVKWVESPCVIHHISRIKERTCCITSINAENTLDKIQ